MGNIYDRRWRIARRLTGGVALVGVLLLSLVLAGGDTMLDDLRAEIIPPTGSETAYGMPLSLDLLPQFIEWSYALLPSVEADSRYLEAMNALVAPCCDDHPMYRCCCEAGGRSCNIVRSGKGLAAYLIAQLDADATMVRESVFEWLRYARPDYYLATEMATREIDPEQYGLTTYGSCYRRMCNVPISEGGCGGMEELIEPAIGTIGT